MVDSIGRKMLMISLLAITLTSCDSLLNTEPDESLVYDVDLPDGFEVSCLGTYLDSEDLPFPVSEEEVEIWENQDHLGERVSSINYICHWSIREPEPGEANEHAWLTIDVNDTNEAGGFDVEAEHEQSRGDLIVDSLEGWDFGYCATKPDIRGAKYEESVQGYDCKASSSNLEIHLDIKTSDEIDMEVLMKELAPIVQGAFDKS